MGASIVLAKILGPYCLIVGIGVLLNRDFYQKVMDDFPKNPAAVYLGGVLGLLFGLFIIGYHNIWTSNWPVIITLVGWIGIAKGALIIVFPDFLGKMIEYHKANPKTLLIRLYIVLGFGAVLTYFGYFA